MLPRVPLVVTASPPSVPATPPSVPASTPNRVRPVSPKRAGPKVPGRSSSSPRPAASLQSDRAASPASAPDLRAGGAVAPGPGPSGPSSPPPPADPVAVVEGVAGQGGADVPEDDGDGPDQPIEPGGRGRHGAVPPRRGAAAVRAAAGPGRIPGRRVGQSIPPATSRMPTSPRNSRIGKAWPLPMRRDTVSMPRSWPARA